MTPRNALHYIMGKLDHASSFFFHTLLQYEQNTLFSLLLLLLYYYLLHALILAHEHLHCITDS